MNKNALSPVVATVLLISLVLVLALIIFLWARASIPEQLEKLGEPVENSCEDVVLVAEFDSFSNILTILNNGNIPVHSFQIGVRKGFSLNYYEGDFTALPSLRGGETINFDLSINAPSSGDKIVVVPVLLGKSSKSGELKAFVCDENYGQVVEI